MLEMQYARPHSNPFVFRELLRELCPVGTVHTAESLVQAAANRLHQSLIRAVHHAP